MPEKKLATTKVIVTIVAITVVLAFIIIYINSMNRLYIGVSGDWTSLPSTMNFTTTINAIPVMTYESTSAGGVGFFNLSLPIPLGYKFTNEALINYTFCPGTYRYFSNHYSGGGGEDGGEYPLISSKGVPYCPFGLPGTGSVNDISNGTFMVTAIAMFEVYNASGGVKLTNGAGNRNINYTINNTYGSWLTMVSLICAAGRPCTISIPSGCKIAQHASYYVPNVTENSSVTLEACSNQSPGEYNFTINASNKTGTSWYIDRYHSGIARSIT